MKVTDHIKQAKSTLFSFEILPPLKGESIDGLFKAIEPLIEFKPSFIDVTYHREEYVYEENGNGLLRKKTVRKRPGTVGICAAIMNRFGIDAVPHIICGGFSREETENALIDLDFLGIDNVLALRGDPIKSEGRFQGHPDGHHFASELIAQIDAMNKGCFAGGEVEESAPTNFCIGAAGYPEKHFEASNLNTDMNYLKKKVELGAEYIVTQMFFDNKKFLKWVDEVRAAGIEVPIIPGLKPLTIKNHLTILPSIFHIDLPDELVNEVMACKSKEAVRQAGIEWCIAQSKELMEKGFPVLHYYSMSRSSAVKKVAEAVF